LSWSYWKEGAIPIEYRRGERIFYVKTAGWAHLVEANIPGHIRSKLAQSIWVVGFLLAWLDCRLLELR